MFDIGAPELLLIVVIAIIVIGPKDLPMALRTAGRWVAKMRRASSHFRTGIDAMIREAELEEMERKWKAQNEAIMREHPNPEDIQAPVSASAEAAVTEQQPTTKSQAQLPLPPP
jgi:sec-independent protein translocase protein TatB